VGVRFNSWYCYGTVKLAALDCADGVVPVPGQVLHLQLPVVIRREPTVHKKEDNS